MLRKYLILRENYRGAEVHHMGADTPFDIAAIKKVPRYICIIGNSFGEDI